MRLGPPRSLIRPKSWIRWRRYVCSAECLVNWSVRSGNAEPIAFPVVLIAPLPSYTSGGTARDAAPRVAHRPRIPASTPLDRSAGRSASPGGCSSRRPEVTRRHADTPMGLPLSSLTEASSSCRWSGVTPDVLPNYRGFQPSPGQRESCVVDRGISRYPRYRSPPALPGRNRVSPHGAEPIRCGSPQVDGYAPFPPNSAQNPADK
jgi:hypothetical protein